jgi:hypothetical protein
LVSIGEVGSWFFSWVVNSFRKVLMSVPKETFDADEVEAAVAAAVEAELAAV